MMQTVRVRNIKRLAVLSAILVIVLLALLFRAQDLVREVVVLPVSYWVWSIGLFVRTTPQIFFWVMALLIAGMIAYSSLAERRKEVLFIPGLEDSESETRLTGRVAFWAGKLHMAGRPGSSYSRASFHTTLVRLLIDLLAHRYRLAPNQVEERLRAGLLDVPQEVCDYVLEDSRRAPDVQAGSLARLWQTIVEGARSWLNPAADSARGGIYADPQVRRILQYMEEELEVSDDDSGR